MMRAVVLATLLVSACFSPTYEEGLACSEADTCPPGQTCGADGFCRGDGDEVDAAVAMDVDAAVQPIYLPPGAVARWSCDDETEAVGGRDFVLTAVNSTPGIRGDALATTVFGTGVASGNGLPLMSADRTVELWVRVDAEGGAEEFFAGYGLFSSNDSTFHLGRTTTQAFVSNWGSGIAGGVLTSGVWHHIAATSAAQNVAIYVDGELRGSGVLAVQTSSGAFRIGRLDDSRFLVGALDEIRVYDRALSANEIRAIYDSR